jgi:hypothetical protein
VSVKRGIKVLAGLGVPGAFNPTLKALRERLKGVVVSDWPCRRSLKIAMCAQCHALRYAAGELPYCIWDDIEGAELGPLTRQALCHEHPPIFVWKVAVFADRNDYNRSDQPRHMEHCRTVFGEPQIATLEPTQIPADCLDRIVSPYSFGTDPRAEALLEWLNRNNVDVWDQHRDVDVSFVGRLDYSILAPPMDHTLLTRHRRAAVPAIKGLSGLNTVAGEAIPTADYYRLLLRSKIAVSPYGVGETCIRDWEAIWAGCVLIKPPVDHVEGFPFHFRCAADFSDLQQIVDEILGQYGNGLLEQMRETREATLRQCSLEARMQVMLGALRPIVGELALCG